MQILLVTGPGGAGSSTVAAATALRLSAGGARVVLLTATAPRVSGLGERVEVDVVAAQPALEQLWARHAERLGGALPVLTVPPASSVVPVPGVQELALLGALAGHVAAGRADAVVLDAGPTPAATALLALPSALRWWLGQATPTRLRVLAALRAAAGPAQSDLTTGLLAGVAGAEELLARVPLADPGRTAVHLVLRPEPAAADEFRTTATALGVLGQRVTSVTVARLLPPGSGEWWAQRTAVQADAVRTVTEAAGAVREVVEAAVPPVTAADLAALDAAVPDVPAAQVPPPGPKRAGEDWVLDLPLPFARRGEVELTRWDDDLVVTTAGVRRSVALDPLLRRCTVTGGALAEPGTAAATLEVRFTPDPAQWPTGLLRPEAGAAADPEGSRT